MNLLLLILVTVIACVKLPNEPSIPSNSQGNPSQVPQTADARNLSVTKLGVSDLDLVWDDSGEKDGWYRVSYTQGDSPPVSCSTADSQISESVIKSSLRTTVTGLAPNTSYAFRLCTIKKVSSSQGETLLLSPGATAIVRTNALPPGEVAGVIITASGTTISLSWTQAIGATGYRVVYSPNSMAAPGNCNSNFTAASSANTTISNVTQNQYYGIRVCSLNSNPTPDVSQGAASSVFVSTGPPPNPSNVVVSALSSTGFRLQFNSGAGNTTKFKIAYKSGNVAPTTCSDGTEYTTSGTAASMDVSFSVVPAAAKYQVRVCAMNGDQVPQLSAGVTGTVSLPIPGVSNLFCNPDTNALKVRWTGGTVNYYYIERLASSPPTSCMDSGAQLISGAIGANVKNTSGAANNTYVVWICGYDATYNPALSAPGKLQVRQPTVAGSSISPGSCSTL